MSRRLAIGLCLALVGSGLGYLGHRMVPRLPENASLPGTQVAFAVQPPDVPLGDFIEARAERLGREEAYLDVGDGVLTLTLAELGFELDVAATMQRALAHAREGTLVHRLGRARRARQGLEEVAPVFGFDPVRARATLERLAPLVATAPVEARLDLEQRLRIESAPGRALDVERTLANLRAVTIEPMLAVRAEFVAVAPQVTTDMIAAVDVSKVLSSYETDFAKKAGPREKNIRVAASYLNGTIIEPGQVMSFNRTVGDRSYERGFVDAPVIVNDEMEPGIGGGVCQVASTLHGAAVIGALEVVQRRSHSRPSGYAPLGMDAAVIYGEVDLKIKNPYDEPVMIHAYLPRRYLLRVEFLGLKPPGKIQHFHNVVEKKPFFRRVTTRSELAPGKMEHKQDGGYGYDVESVVRLTLPDGTRQSRSYKSRYWPVPEVYWVAPGFDLSTLPPLPDGAERVEVDAARASDTAAATEGRAQREVRAGERVEM